MRPPYLLTSSTWVLREPLPRPDMTRSVGPSL
jgi:hypothetical protein